jgi:hypothetical protein
MIERRSTEGKATQCIAVAMAHKRNQTANSGGARTKPSAPMSAGWIFPECFETAGRPQETGQSPAGIFH